MSSIAKVAVLLLQAAGWFWFAAFAQAQARSDTAAYSSIECPPCAGWNAATRPLQLHGNTHYVGTRGLAAILITSPDGHILLDGGLPESAPLIMRSISALGFRVNDIKLIVNSHVHYDHAGGIAALQRASGAVVAASPKAAAVLRSGRVGPDDPQYGIALAFPAVARVRVIADGDTLRVGRLLLVAHFTPGHTPGGTSWSWQSCERDECLTIVYADSQTAVSADGFRFTGSAAAGEFERSFATLERLACDVLLTPHPDASRLWQRLAARDAARGLADRAACRRYAATARTNFARRLANEAD